MKKRLIILLLAIATFFSSQSQEQKEPVVRVSSGRIERIADFNSEYIAPRNIDVWLPDGYLDREKYAVLYMHDGQMLFDSTTTWNKQDWGVDDAMKSLLDQGKIRETIVVGIWNTQSRHSEYFPQKPFEMLDAAYRDSLLARAKRNPETALFATDVKSDSYLKFLVEELKPFIDARYSTKTTKEETFIAGSSMGGLISLYAICEYPEVFGGVACLSTHWIGTFETENNPFPAKFMEYLKQKLPDPATHKIYFDFGTETLDAFYEPYQNQVNVIMKNSGYNDTNWMTKKFPGQDHSENAWKSRLFIPLTFLVEVQK
jgi:enterochelin esterase-like enzyme